MKSHGTLGHISQVVLRIGGLQSLDISITHCAESADPTYFRNEPRAKSVFVTFYFAKTNASQTSQQTALSQRDSNLWVSFL